MPEPILLWLRQDLRLADQPALISAMQQGAVIPVYVLDDDAPGKTTWGETTGGETKWGDWRIGGAQRWWLHHSLASLGADLAAKGSRLILRRGPAESVLRGLLAETGARRIHAIRHYEPWWRAAEAALADVLCLHDGNHLVPVEQVRRGSSEPYRVYSAFWRALQQQLPPATPLPAPRTIPAPEQWPGSDELDSWQLLPGRPGSGTPDWASRFGADWTPGEAEALAKAADWADDVHNYADMRDLPSEAGTSLLSPHLHFGELSPRTLYQQVHARAHAEKFLKELAWRDFADGVILALPDYPRRNGRAKYDALRWRKGAAAREDLRAWQQGQTGYPIVDAGMRQLWTSGWMHNRVRMICASFLVKHLLIDWRAGERWFWDCLVDADYGNNSVNWQWVAGTGVDANMFSRIMAPLTQSEKFAAGDYIRRWVPELAHLPDATIHDPEAAGCLPKGYPAKIIGHREARERALAAARELR